MATLAGRPIEDVGAKQQQQLVRAVSSVQMVAGRPRVVDFAPPAPPPSDTALSDDERYAVQSRDTSSTATHRVAGREVSMSQNTPVAGRSSSPGRNSSLSEMERRAKMYEDMYAQEEVGAGRGASRHRGAGGAGR